jgi:hypothetical protein
MKIVSLATFWNAVKEFIPLATFITGIIGFGITWDKFSQENALIQKNDSELIYRHKQEFNNLLLDEPEVAKNMGLNKNAIAGFILVNDLEKLFVLRCKGFITDKQWVQVEEMIHGQLDQPGHFRKQFWDKPINANSPTLGRRFFNPVFVEYVHELTDGDKPRERKDSVHCSKISKDI